MNRGPIGDHQVITTFNESVRAFVPRPLPPVPTFDISGPRQALLERALLACGRLDGLSRLLPDPDVFLYSYVRREAVLSSQIEGTQSSLSDLLAYEIKESPGAPLDDVVEVSNYVAALDHGMARPRQGFPLSNRLLREVHGKLMEKGPGADKAPGEFRTSQNWIGGSRPGNAWFVPPPPHLVQDCMGALEKFIHDTADPMSALVRAAAVHVQFETIHPFLDGNGRVGRLLISLMLHDAGVFRQPLLYLSLYFKQRRSEYYDLLDAVRCDGDWEAWLDFFLEGVTVTAGSAVETAERLLALFAADRAVIAAKCRAPGNVLRVFDILRTRPLRTIADLARQADVTVPTAGTAVKSLANLGVVREITGRRRGRVFAYGAYLDILSEGTEPL